MAGRANDPIVIPHSLWERSDTRAALSSRDVGRLFALLRQFAGASQTQIAVACGMTQSKISYIMRGIQRVESLEVFERIADGLNMPDSARTTLGLASRASPVPLPQSHECDACNRAYGHQPRAVNRLRRRTFVGLTGASIVGGLLADGSSDGASLDVEPFARVLAGNTAVDDAVADSVTPDDLDRLTADVNDARRRYQGCRYADLTKRLPSLLTHLDSACSALIGDAQDRAYVLSADAYHVAAGLLLKLADEGLAYLAADRSMRAAQTSNDPVAVGASARIVTHALMDGDHLSAAISTASGHATRLACEMRSQTPDSLAVYGALLLRGSVAAAQHGKRDTAHELLGEAEDAAGRLGEDGNLRWTAFGPINTTLHRVNIAVTLGDAGTAIDVARKVDLNKITVTERKASFLIDVARAFLQWDRHEQSYRALRAAHVTAPEEVAGRPSAHHLLRSLLATAPPSVSRDATEFATEIGVLS